MAENAPSDPPALLEAIGLTKRFGALVANDNVSLAIRAGETHALLGENGAGKSTLIKIVSGVIAPDEGSMVFDRRPVSFTNPQAANAAGIVAIFQELSVLPDLSVADNIRAACRLHSPHGFLHALGRGAGFRAEEARVSATVDGSQRSSFVGVGTESGSVTELRMVFWL